MRLKLGLILTIQAILVIALAVALRAGVMPLGIPGEWEWIRMKVWPGPDGLLLAGTGIAVYCGLAAIGLRALSNSFSLWREAGWLFGLFVASIGVQVAIPTGAADEYDLTKWAYVHYFPGSAGYYRVARDQALSDPWKFMADYPAWIRGQDSLHIGTHPPGLIALQCLTIRGMERNPRIAEQLLRMMPFSTADAFRQLEKIDRRVVPRADRAALLLISVLTLMACAGTVVPLYLLARASLPAPAAWCAAALWPLAPAANLFQPVADTAYPLFSTSALALAVWAARSGRSKGMAMAVYLGLVLAVGVFFSLAFLPVGLVVALVLLLEPGIGVERRLGLIMATGVGFLGLTAVGWMLTAANPLVVWTWNLSHHARFYVEYPRTYLSWLLANPIELTIALGLPSAVWCVVGCGFPRGVPRVAWATLGVLVLLNLSGRNMGEVARLWMLFLPPLLTAAGAGLERIKGGPRALACSLGFLAFQTLALQTYIQVVYPV